MRQNTKDLTVYRQIIFDFGNILINLDIPATWRAFAALAGTERDHYRLSSAQQDIFDQFEKGQLTEQDFLQHLQQSLPGKVSVEDIRQAWNAMLLDIPQHRLDMLIQLRKSHHVYLLSNTNEIHLRFVFNYLKETYGITDFNTRFFDRTFYSHEVGKRKPDPTIFEYVLQEINAIPEETLFIDDLPENLVAPAALGIHTMLHDPAQDIAQVLGFTAQGIQGKYS